ncbi:N-acetylglucosamine kinase [Microlunatus elymi]|uniref:N-acetylglucosamine kinase n=1 Tax=Microlunatus elymi TaxID=2596828 RepID=A0A516Q0W6_9ACTN|nr:BadF/BadG/BcrA/BcrD ATPase family protein [Microlunatus elymi]QDP97076.1 N-acetylglucosamine kinase [Microlunatus elymi]
MRRLLIGADVGGTSTRVAVADRTGAVLTVARQPAGNPNAVGVQTSAERIRAAIGDALRQAQGFSAEAGVDAVVLGIAGFGTAIEAGAEFLDAALPDEIAASTVRIVSDLAVGYASATPLPRGYVVIAGTGSGAAEIDRGEILARRGSWGWLLGDEGGGFWLGREAVRSALAEVERRQPYGALTRAVLDELKIPSADPADALAGLVRVPYLSRPVELAELAPIVTGLVDSDPAATAICAGAVEHLTRLLLELQPRPGRPIVAAGSVLQTPGPISAGFAVRLHNELAGPVLEARSGLVGALWLAACDSAARTGSEPPDPGLHARFVGTLIER